LGQRKKRHPLYALLIVLLTAFCLLGISFRLVLLPPVTTVIAQNTVNTGLSSVSYDELVKVAQMGRAFVAGEPGAQLPVGDDEKTAFPPDVVSHMEDVQKVIHNALIVTLVLMGLLLVVLLVAGLRAGKRTISTGLAFGGILAVVMVLVLSVLGFMNFDRLFIVMHELLFSQGNWTFAEDSLLICAYPLPFWIGMGAFWAVALLVISAITTTLGFLLRRGGARRAQV